MSILNILSKARGPRNLVSRIRAILRNFGLTSTKFEHLLQKYSTLTRDLGCVPTFAITAVTLKRHPQPIKELHEQGVEFAIHGYIHTDYRLIKLEEQIQHFNRAIDIFEGCQVPYTGFRAPFLRINGKTPQALSNLGFTYDSSHSIRWDVIDKNKYKKGSLIEYKRVLDFYEPRKAQDYLVLPRSMDGFIEIPVSIPDDEVIIDRLNITDINEISEIWTAILEKTYRGGELFTVQLHPERIAFCEEALANVIQEAKILDPPVWITTLGETTNWWQERKGFTFEINHQGNDNYRIKANCSERATILIKNCRANVLVNEWFDDYQSIKARDFILESPLRPVIGIGRDSSPAAVSFLQAEGYIVEQNDQPDGYAIHLGNVAQFDEADEKPLSRKIELSYAPLLRYWRWPDQARSALSVTGDIDSMTLFDFALRIFENWRQNGRR
jgi:peptidoglycan/xylan/chitin deacetylase (PgdA/CDA1 family)